MLPKKHIILGLIFSLTLIFLFPAIGWKGFGVIFLSSVFIDIDHYLYFIFKKKDINLMNSYNWFIKKRKEFFSVSREQRNKTIPMLFVFHGIEVLLIVFVLSFFSRIFFFIFLGFSFHLLVDSIIQTTYWNRIDKVSLIYDFLKCRKLKTKHDNPKQ